MLCANARDLALHFSGSSRSSDDAIGKAQRHPASGSRAGGAFGAGAGALSGSLIDYGINDDFIREIGNTLQPGTSALFVLVRKAQPEKVFAELHGISGRVLRSSLSPEQEARLQAVLAREQTSASQPGEPQPVQTALA